MGYNKLFLYTPTLAAAYGFCKFGASLKLPKVIKIPAALVVLATIKNWNDPKFNCYGEMLNSWQDRSVFLNQFLPEWRELDKRKSEIEAQKRKSSE